MRRLYMCKFFPFRTTVHRYRAASDYPRTAISFPTLRLSPHMSRGSPRHKFWILSRFPVCRHSFSAFAPTTRGEAKPKTRNLKELTRARGSNADSLTHNGMRHLFSHWEPLYLLQNIHPWRWPRGNHHLEMEAHS